MKRVLELSVIAKNFLDEDSFGLCCDALSSLIAYAAQEQQKSVGTSTNKQMDKICPKSAVLRIDGTLVCIEDGEPCPGHDKDCNNF